MSQAATSMESLQSSYQRPGGCGESGKKKKKVTRMIRKVNAGGGAQLLLIKRAPRLTCRGRHGGGPGHAVTHRRLKGFGLKPGAAPGEASSFMRR